MPTPSPARYERPVLSSASTRIDSFSIGSDPHVSCHSCRILAGGGPARRRGWPWRTTRGCEVLPSRCRRRSSRQASEVTPVTAIDKEPVHARAHRGHLIALSILRLAARSSTLSTCRAAGSASIYATRNLTGPIRINREHNQRRWVVQGNVRGRDLGGVFGLLLTGEYLSVPAACSAYAPCS